MAQRPKASRQSGVVQIVHDWLIAERPWKMLAISVAVVIAIGVAVMLGSGFVMGHGAYWQQPLYDAGAHLDGWLFFSQDSWHFPIFDTYRTAFPDGTSIILTDSLPLVALIAKTVGLGLLDNWHYFGWFVVAAYVLNGVSLLWLLRQIGVSNVLGALFAIIFAVCSALHNIQFESFFAHFTVIFSLGFYIRLTRAYKPVEMAWFMAMVLAALLIHPYLFAMSAGILVVTMAQVWRQKQLRGKRLAIWLAAFGGATAFMVWMTGYVAREPRGFEDHLFGLAPTFALDLTAAFQRVYSPNEIGTYFGLGFWLLVLGGLFVMRRKLLVVVRRHVWLVALSIGFILFSISTTLFFNGHTLIKVPMPEALMSLFEMFRASKRFIMPVFYLAATIGLVWLLRSRRPWAAGLILLALILQVVDMSYFWQAQSSVARTGQSLTFDQAPIRKDLQTVSHMNVFPSYSCLYGSGVVPMSWETPLELQHIAATEQKITNSVRTSRRTQDCTAESIRAILAPQPDSMNVYLRNSAGQFIFEPSERCVHRVDFKYGVYCRLP